MLSNWWYIYKITLCLFGELSFRTSRHRFICMNMLDIATQGIPERADIRGLLEVRLWMVGLCVGWSNN
jgi:hypothetical protein